MSLIITHYLPRQSWSSQFDLRESHLLAISAAEQELLNADYEDYAAASSRGIAFCHTVALIVCSIVLSQLKCPFHLSMKFLICFWPFTVDVASLYPTSS